jgi:predicted metal-dependent phosphoesterase TrpH
MGAQQEKIMTQSIRELKALQAEALEKYHAEYARLEAEIKAIRQARGTVLKAKPFGEYYEAGRSREPSPRMG